jgi:hypothetical protein
MTCGYPTLSGGVYPPGIKEFSFLLADGWLMKENLPRVLPLLHTHVEERVGERRFWPIVP